MRMMIALLATLSILGAASAGPEPSFSFRVTGCAETETGMPSKTRAGFQTIGATIEVIGSGIRYTRAGTHQCCRKVVVRRQVQKGRIALTEYWTGDGCRCMCSSRIEANLAGLAPGEYEVVVYSGGIEPITHKDIEPKAILSQKVRVP
ncbi:MAG: hypothetical protein RDU83_08910 [bacterium]|nr:hypothetical protein [bacterium]